MYITDVDNTVGPFSDSHSVSLALAALRGKDGEKVSVTVPGTGLTIDAESAPEPSEDRPPIEAVQLLTEAMIEKGPVRLDQEEGKLKFRSVRLDQEEGKLKFRSFPPGYLNELLYADSKYGPEDYQRRVVEYFKGLDDSDDESKQRLVKALSIKPVLSSSGGHPGVALSAKGTDWRKEGVVFDPWTNQGGESSPSEVWLEEHEAGKTGTARRPDPPVRVAVRGPVALRFGTGGAQVGWSAFGSVSGGSGVRLSRTKGIGEMRYYAAFPASTTMSLEATDSGTFEVLVRAGEGRLIDFPDVSCRRGQRFTMKITKTGADTLSGPGGSIAGKLYDLSDTTRNEEVLPAKSGKFDHKTRGKFTRIELQVNVPKPGTYSLRITQAVSLSPTWGDVMSAPEHDYEVTVSLESLQ